jgi:anti-sigma regulatory factor (Ser/Thr protein kinase)
MGSSDVTGIGETAGGAPSLRAAITLPADVDSPSQARAFVHERLQGTPVSDDVLADVLVVVSELVSNAVQHGSGDPRLELRLDRSCVHVEVGDDAVNAPPTPRPHDGAAFRGRGLLIVAAVADRWGHARRGDVKWIWAELDASTARVLAAGPVG